MSEKKQTDKATVEQAMEYPGVARSREDNKVTPGLEKQATEELNNNPRNGDL